MVCEENEQLQKLLYSTSKDIERKKIQSAQSKINIGLERKRKCDDDLARYWGKKQEVAKKIVFHPCLLPVTDSTHLLEVSVFLCFSEHELILSASFEQYVFYSLL